MKPVYIFLICFTAFVMFGAKAEAKEMYVKNKTELSTALSQINEDSTIVFDKNFENEYRQKINLNYATKHKLKLNINHVNLFPMVDIEILEGQEILIQNMNFDGENHTGSIDGRAEISVKYKGDGLLKFDNVKIANLQYEKYRGMPLNVSGNVINGNEDFEGRMEFNEFTLINNNFTSSDGIFFGSENMHVNISNATFSNNQLAYGSSLIKQSEDPRNQSGGISSLPEGSFNMTNTKISNNKGNCTQLCYRHNSMVQIESIDQMNINHSVFENNELIVNDARFTAIFSGAIYIENSNSSLIEVKNSTFSQNKTTGIGAIAIINQNRDNVQINLENNTFYKNESIVLDADNLYQGTVYIADSIGNDLGRLNNKEIYTKNNTFYKNSIKRDTTNSEIPETAGAAYNIDVRQPDVDLLNDLLVGNELVDVSNKKFENVIVNDNFTENNNIGFDNGTVTKHAYSQVYGKYPLQLSDNGNENKAGASSTASIIQTLMVIPKMNDEKIGISNMAGGNGTTTDQRGFERKGKSDIGAVEISSILYDANGGKFTLDELSKYDGKTYYEGENPKKYAKVSTPGAEYNILDGKKELKPVRKGHEFLGWSDRKNSSKPNEIYNKNTKHKVDDQIVLYAVWQKKLELKYFSNGKTSGVVPTQKSVITNSTVTIKSQGKLKRKGYKFSGWSTKPSAKKGEAAYAPGKKLKLVKNTKLYAIWKR